MEIFEVGLGDELIEIFQSHLVFHEQDDVVGALAAHAVLAYLQQHGLDVADALRALFAQHGDEALHHPRHDHRVVARAVVVELRQREIVADRVQLVAFQVRQKRLRQNERVQINGVEVDPVALCSRGEEADVEVGVVGDDGSAAAEIEEGAERLAVARRAGNVAVVDAGELHDLRRDGHFRVDEGVEGVLDLAAGEEHRADFRDAVAVGIQPGAFDVEGDELRVQREIAGAMDGEAVVHVVDVVALKPVDDLDPRLFRGVPCVRKRLRAAVVRDGDGFVAPLRRALDRLGDGGQRVERGEGGVEVELHALFLRRVLPHRGRRGDLDVARLEREVVVIAVIADGAGDGQIHPVLNLVYRGAVGVVVAQEAADLDGVRLVRDAEAEHGCLMLRELAAVRREHAAADDDVAALQRKRVHRNGLALDGAAHQNVARAGLTSALCGAGGGLRRGGARKVGADLHAREGILLAQTALEHIDLRRRGHTRKAGVYQHRAALALDLHARQHHAVQPPAQLRKRSAAGENL